MAAGDDAAPAATKISISRAALAALLQRCAMADGDCDGLLSGLASSIPAPPPSLSDYDNHAPAQSTTALSISISGHSSLSRLSSLSDPLGRFQPSSPAGPTPIGFFSSRRRTALRPSMRDTTPSLRSLRCPGFRLRSPRRRLQPTHTIGEQNAVDGMVGGFEIERLQGIVSSVAGQATEVDGMYAGMLKRLEKLAREVEKSNLLVLKQVIY
ncbi:hypothetical protein E2562_038150 [Oryza meyeriana var. granulata]|uniref:Uncharacterized protein n=1 Tax=Oryza meyeriana var. granulata TaxID=110450 RepID=A0A6G1DA10_9ORYZ|nr:hypothetical protein E2562_038150 [Oryza meyeriana var. granulata]